MIMLFSFLVILFKLIFSVVVMVFDSAFEVGYCCLLVLLGLCFIMFAN